jgi:hypothetical protein
VARGAWDLAFHCIALTAVDPDFAREQLGVFDRSAPLPTGGHLEQADGTAWVALFCQNRMELAAELACEDSSYEDMCGRVATVREQGPERQDIDRQITDAPWRPGQRPPA